MRTNNGAFQISRSIYDSDIWMKPPEWLKVWIYLLGRVNYEDNNLFKRGENLFNYQVIAIECGVSYNVVNKCINFLKSAKQVSTRKTTRGVVLAINNYDTYQDLSSYRQNRSKTEAKQKQNQSYTITEQYNNITNKIDTSVFQEYIDNPENESITFYLIKYFLLLGWKPAKDETIEKIRKWVKEVFEENEVKDASKMKSSIEIWYEYWKEEKPPKNIKNTFRSTLKFSIPGKN